MSKMIDCLTIMKQDFHSFDVFVFGSSKSFFFKSPKDCYKDLLFPFQLIHIKVLHHSEPQAKKKF